MTSHRPYLVRALNEWILDNNCTPYILVNAYAAGVEVPQNFVKDGQIVLNIAPIAVQGLVMNNEGLEFNGRFGGIPTRVYVPIDAVMGIYARENGQGMIFEYEGSGTPPPPAPVTALDENASAAAVPSSKAKPKGKPSLKVVK
ncbi:MAG: ClpXP protease specificity-enhancing factor [Pseudomonadales bacterium]|nr:ClpXP protease specificity-enhancing factor [Pseudomonadales bacterium]